MALLPQKSPTDKPSLASFCLDLYDIPLWTDAEHWSHETPFAISINYLRSFSTDQLVDKTIDELERLGTPNHQSYRNQLKPFFPSVRIGDRIKSYFNPNSEVTFFFNRSKLGSIQDADF
jgi:hypothetical protein